MYFNIILEGIFEGSHTNKEIRLKLENDYEKNKIKSVSYTHLRAHET